MNTSYLNNDLIDVTNSNFADQNSKYFNEEESFELYETCFHLMEEIIKNNPTIISEPDFEEIFDENIIELMHSQFDYDIFYTNDSEDEMEEIIELAKHDFFKNIIPPRSYNDTIILKNPDINFIEKQINVLRNKMINKLVNLKLLVFK